MPLQLGFYFHIWRKRVGGSDDMETPKIEIICDSADSKQLAESIEYGIEEEGIPSHTLFKIIDPLNKYDISQDAKLGVAIFICEGHIEVYSRILKERRPLFKYEGGDLSIANIVGKNAARIIKNKPFIEFETNIL